MLEQILCIDDDPITLMLCKKVISKSSFSHEIITAQNGEEALHHFNTLKYTNNKNKVNKKPELIFLDLNMPHMNGWQVLDTLISLDTPVVIKVYILSSSVDFKDKLRAKDYPLVKDYILKPLESELAKNILR